MWSTEDSCVRLGELRVADAPGTVSERRCREARFPNGLFASVLRVRVPPGALLSAGIVQRPGPQPSKLPIWVRIPLPAPSFSLSCGNAGTGLRNRSIHVPDCTEAIVSGIGHYYSSVR